MPGFVLPQLLDERYATLKKSIILKDKAEAVTSSWKRLLVQLEKESKKIAQLGSNSVPTFQWDTIAENGNQLTEQQSEIFKQHGVALVKGVVDREQIDKWYQELVTFVKDNKDSTGYSPNNSASFYNVFWTKPQTEARFHPNIVKLFNCFNNQFYLEDESKAYIDLLTQVVYGDRIRIRQPGAAALLNLHLDSSSIERWEDLNYREAYRKILDGNWEEWDPWRLDEKQFAQEDLYHYLGENRYSYSICSTFRTLQGWLALSDNKTGEGTLRVYPNVKLAAAYIILRPFFWDDPSLGDIDDYKIDLETPKFPGVTPSTGILFVDDKLFPHLRQLESVVGIPDVNKGDFVFWHADLPHEVDKSHNGPGVSSVFYYAAAPLAPGNIGTLLDTRHSWRKNISPKDYKSHLRDDLVENQGVDDANLKNDDSKRSMGLLPFEINESLTNSQKRIREIANKALEDNSFDLSQFLELINVQST